MSMIFNLHRFPLAEVEQLLQDPEGIIEKIDAAFEVEVAEGQMPDFLDLDKAWHGIHFLLTGTAWEGSAPWCYLLQGGQTLGDVDLGYGPARMLSSEQVKEFHSALAGLDVAAFAERFDRGKLEAEEIYPSVWDPEDEAMARTYLSDYYQLLQKFMAEAATANQVVIIYLS